MSSLQPTLTNERIGVLEMLRGMAIFGILFVNLAHFSYPDMYLSMLGKENFFYGKVV
ncbi:putative integral inner membrane protein [Bacillus tequilensis]|nr:putative integral inner membrane protein [Bacillus tequilensis]